MKLDFVAIPVWFFCCFFGRRDKGGRGRVSYSFHLRETVTLEYFLDLLMIECALVLLFPQNTRVISDRVPRVHAVPVRRFTLSRSDWQVGVWVGRSVRWVGGYEESWSVGRWVGRSVS